MRGQMIYKSKKEPFATPYHHQEDRLSIPVGALAGGGAAFVLLASYSSSLFLSPLVSAEVYRRN